MFVFLGTKEINYNVILIGVSKITTVQTMQILYSFNDSNKGITPLNLFKFCTKGMHN